jgi:hypothetical protein
VRSAGVASAGVRVSPGTAGVYCLQVSEDEPLISWAGHDSAHLRERYLVLRMFLSIPCLVLVYELSWSEVTLQRSILALFVEDLISLLMLSSGSAVDLLVFLVVFHVL